MATTREKALSGSLAIAMAVTPMIKGFEGRSLKTYRDVIGVLTYCDGETENAVPGKTYTDAECDAITVSKVNEFARQVDQIIPPEPKPVRMALTSFAYNEGIGNLERSTLLKKLKAGDLTGACNEFPKWNMAHGIVWPGLTSRREREKDLCLSGVQDVGSD